MPTAVLSQDQVEDLTRRSTMRTCMRVVCSGNAVAGCSFSPTGFLGARQLATLRTKCCQSPPMTSLVWHHLLAAGAIATPAAVKVIFALSRPLNRR